MWQFIEIMQWKWEDWKDNYKKKVEWDKEIATLNVTNKQLLLKENVNKKYFLD